MGVYLEFNIYSQKWELRGCGFRWEFDTKEEAEANRADAWQLHVKKLKAHRMCHQLLSGCR